MNCSRKTQRSVPIKDVGVNVLKACDNSDAPNFFAGLERARLVGNGSWLMTELVRLGEGAVLHATGFTGLS